MKLPEMLFEEAEDLSRRCGYAWEACVPEGDSINGADAVAFFLEGYDYARKQLEEQFKEKP